MFERIGRFRGKLREDDAVDFLDCCLLLGGMKGRLLLRRVGMQIRNRIKESFPPIAISRGDDPSTLSPKNKSHFAEVSDCSPNSAGACLTRNSQMQRELPYMKKQIQRSGAKDCRQMPIESIWDCQEAAILFENGRNPFKASFTIWRIKRNITFDSPRVVIYQNV